MLQIIVHSHDDRASGMAYSAKQRRVLSKVARKIDRLDAGKLLAKRTQNGPTRILASIVYQDEIALGIPGFGSLSHTQDNLPDRRRPVINGNEHRHALPLTGLARLL